MFALFMGLSNFGSDAGRYLGSSLLTTLGGVVKPGDYTPPASLPSSVADAVPLVWELRTRTGNPLRD